jgi:hypothetical protein
MNLFSLTPVGTLEKKAKSMISNVYPNILDQINYEIVPYIPTQAKDLAKETNGFLQTALMRME